MNSVAFNRNVTLVEVEGMTDGQVFKAWIDRIREYYIRPTSALDEGQNGFASLILQLCAVDAASSFLSSDRTTEDKIRNFCKNMILRSQGFSQARNPGKPALSDLEIEDCTRHLYFQYRCGLVHNGFTLQFGNHSRNNVDDHIFLISYETSDPLTTNEIRGKKAFIVNPTKFRSMVQHELQSAEQLSKSLKDSIGLRIRESLHQEIEIAKMLESFKPGP